MDKTISSINIIGRPGYPHANKEKYGHLYHVKSQAKMD